MRDVLIKTWEPAHKDDKGNVVGGRYGDYKAPGKFHQWGCSYEEFEGGPGNYTVGIVELPDGAIQEVLPSQIKFIS
jgi:hypothetical protein